MTNPFYDPYAVLQKVYGRGSWLKQALAETPVEELHRARTVRACYGVLENDLYFDACIRAFAPKTPKLPVRILLKIALYFLLVLKKPRYMVTDSAVSLAKKLGKGGAAGFLNAFLRAFDEAKVPQPAGEAERLSLTYSVPLFAVNRLLAQYGREAEEIVRRRPPRTFVRFVSDEAARPYLERCTYEQTPFANLYAFPAFRRDGAFDEGKYTFQSVGSVAICEGIEPCGHLLDACAAPGGKSVLLAGRCGRVTAFELHPHRAELIRAYAARMGVKNIEIVCRDSSVHEEKYDGAFGAVLVDAPCSGYGVTGENPDIKLFRKEEDLAALCKVQRAILNACAPYVRAGGCLYYSTCSVFGEENDGAVAAFLAANGEFSVERAESPLGHKKTAFGLQFLPHLSMGAGFYFCKLRRRA